MAARETVEKAYALLGSTRPGADLTKLDVEACTMVLDPIPDDAVLKAAIMLSRKEGDFLPSAGTLFQTALDLLDSEPPADEAWTLVRQHASHASLSTTNPVHLPERIATALENIGGDIGWTLDEIPYRRREFIAAYERLGKQWRTSIALGNVPCLPGAEQKRLAP